MRLVAGGFEQTVSSDTDFYAGTPKLTTLRALLTIAARHGSPEAFGYCHSAFHKSPMPSDSEPVCVEPWTLPKYGFARKLSGSEPLLLVLPSSPIQIKDRFWHRPFVDFLRRWNQTFSLGGAGTDFFLGERRRQNQILCQLRGCPRFFCSTPKSGFRS